MARALLVDLVERGVPTDRALLFVIDGAKALRKAIREVVGRHAVVHRWQVHPRRQRPGPPARARAPCRAPRDPAGLRASPMRSAPSANSADSPAPPSPTTRARPCPCARDSRRPSRSTAWGSRALFTARCGANPIENLNGIVDHFARNVTRWRGGTMAMRWAAASIREAQRCFRCLHGHRGMRTLVAALDRHVATLDSMSRRCRETAVNRKPAYVCA